MQPVVTITTRFEQVVKEVEDGLRVSLRKARAQTRHPVTKGTTVEDAARDVLREYMPPNLSIGEGGVYDSYGDESGQMDIVIANGDQPFTFPPGRSGEYVIEGVSAVGEVKSNLTANELTDCIDKAQKYKQLRPIFGYQDQVTNLSDYMRESDMIPPFFVLALESRMKIETVLNRLKKAALVEIPPNKPCSNATAQPPLDAVCILGKGLVLYQRTSVGPLFHVLSTGEPYVGYYSIDGTTPLANPLGWLHTAMPRQLRRESVVRQYFIPTLPAAKYRAAKQSAAPAQPRKRAIRSR
jgi:hypothetical protein